MTNSGSDSHRVSDRLLQLEDLELVRIARLQLPYVTTAYEVLFYRYHSKLVQVCYRYLGSVEEAEEAVNDTMLNVFHSLAGFNQQASFKTWIYRIAHNQALTRLRKKKIDSIDISNVDEELLCIEDSTAGEGDKKLNQLLAKLNLDERSIVVFRIAADLEFKDIAIVVEQKLSTVKMRYKRALEKMALNVRDEDE